MHICPALQVLQAHFVFEDWAEVYMQVHYTHIFLFFTGAKKSNFYNKAESETKRDFF